jgi:hypothetical protein
MLQISDDADLVMNSEDSLAALSCTPGALIVEFPSVGWCLEVFDKLCVRGRLCEYFLCAPDGGRFECIDRAYFCRCSI